MIFETFATFIQKIMMFSAYVNNNSSFPKPLTIEQEQMYLDKMLDGDIEAKNILIHHNLRLVAHIVKKYSHTEEADDLISAGSLGLIKAINTYKKGHGTQFSTYASKCIENEILMLLRVNKKHKNNLSIDEILSNEGSENEISFMDIVHDEDVDVEQNMFNYKDNKKINKLLLKHLSNREYEIMCLRYGLNDNPILTQREVAKKLNISRSYISRIEKKSLETLKQVCKIEDFY